MSLPIFAGIIFAGLKKQQTFRLIYFNDYWVKSNDKALVIKHDTNFSVKNLMDCIILFWVHHNFKDMYSEVITWSVTESTSSGTINLHPRFKVVSTISSLLPIFTEQIFAGWKKEKRFRSIYFNDYWENPVTKWNMQSIY